MTKQAVILSGGYILSVDIRCDYLGKDACFRANEADL
jgi:hypothetical protein